MSRIEGLANWLPITETYTVLKCEECGRYDVGATTSFLSTACCLRGDWSRSEGPCRGRLLECKDPHVLSAYALGGKDAVLALNPTNPRNER